MCGSVRLFSEHGRDNPARRPDHQAGFGRAVAQHFLHVLESHRNAAGGGSKILPCKMKEYGAAAALNAGPLVVAGLHHNIIEMVGALQILVGGGIGQVHPAIVIPVPQGFTPTPATLDRRRRDFRQGTDEAVSAVVNPAQKPEANGSSAVAFPLQDKSAGSSQDARHHKGTTGQHTTGGARADRARRPRVRRRPGCPARRRLRRVRAPHRGAGAGPHGPPAPAEGVRRGAVAVRSAPA